MYTEESVVDAINVRHSGHIEIRVSNNVLNDWEVISTNYHRHVISPGDDISQEDARVRAVAGAVWTPEVIADFLANVPSLIN